MGSGGGPPLPTLRPDADDSLESAALQGWVYLRFHEALVRSVQDRGGVGWAEGEDLVQELYLRLPDLFADWGPWLSQRPWHLETEGTWTPDECRVFGRLSGCLRKLAANSRRRRNRRSGIRERLSTRSTDRLRNARVMSRTDAAIDVEYLLGLLPVKDAQLLRLRFLDDLPYAAIAKAVGTSEGAARVRLHRALKEVRKYVTIMALKRSS